MLRGQPGPSFFKVFLLSEKWSHKNLSDSIFLTPLFAPHSVSITQSREDFFPLTKMREGKKDLCPQMTQMHADGGEEQL
jgi:hypothetical protein